MAQQVSEQMEPPRASPPARQTASNVPWMQLVAQCAGRGGEYSSKGMASVVMVALRTGLRGVGGHSFTEGTVNQIWFSI